MPLFFISVINHRLQSRDQGAEYASSEAAMAIGIEGGLAIAAEEIRGGEPNTAIEIIVQGAEGQPALRSIVSVAVSPLLLSADPDAPEIEVQDP